MQASIRCSPNRPAGNFKLAVLIYIGEGVDIDIDYPCRDWDIHINRRSREAIPHKKPVCEVKEETPTPRLMAGALARFVHCSTLRNVDTEEATNTFVNDRAQCLGTSRRIILDRGGPGFTDRE